MVTIGEKSMEINDDAKWNEVDSDATTNLHLALANEVLSSVERKRQQNKYGILLQNCTRTSLYKIRFS